MADRKELVPISPIKEMVTGFNVKVQVQLDEDATNQEILSSLDDACKQWSNIQKIDMGLRLVVGRLLMAVREREIYKQEQWGTFEAFLKYVEERYGLKRTTAQDSLMIVEADPELTVERARRIGPTNLLLAARAVNFAPENEKKRIAKRLFREAEKRPPVDEFRQRLQDAKLLRTSYRGRSRGMGKLVIDNVPTSTMHKWRQIVGAQKASRVFADLVDIAYRAEQQLGKGVRQAGV